MIFTRDNPGSGYSYGTGHRGLIHWLSNASPAVRLAIALSLCVHALGLASLLVARGSPGQIADAPSSGNVQTVLALDSPQPVPQAAPATPSPRESIPEPALGPQPESPPEPDPQPVARPEPAIPTSLFSSEPSDTRAATPPTRLTPPPIQPTTPTPPRPISFAGMDAKRAERIVYVVDASGPMVSHWAWATAQLRLSLLRLDESQKFQVLISRLLPAPTGQPDAMRAAEVLSFSGNDLAPTPATPPTITRAIVWLSGQRLRGASDPLPGLSRALSLKPDLILLLSHSFSQGLRANVGRTNEDVLAELDRLNPQQSDGRRAVVIKTIQLGNEDSTGLLQAIANEHGDGPGSYHVVTPAELEKIDGSK